MASSAALRNRNFEVVLPGNHPGQVLVFGEAQRDNTLVAGRRWEKTSTCVKVAANAILEARMAEVFWGAPTYDQVMTGYEELRKVFAEVPGLRAVRKPYPEINIPHMGRIRFRSLNMFENIRSKTASGWVLDEAGDIADEAYTSVVRPTLITPEGVESGWIWKVGTPKGRNWFYREYMRALEGGRGTKAWQIATLGCKIVGGQLIREPNAYENPRVPWEEVVLMFETLPEREFRREVMAEFLQSGGYVFSNVDDVSTLDMQDPIQGHQYVMGVDWGRQDDFTVFSIIDITTARQVYLQRSNQLGYDVQMSSLTTLIDRYNVYLAVCEKNAMGDPLVHALAQAGLPVFGFTTTHQSKARIIDGLALALERGHLFLLNDPVQMGELKAFQPEVLPSGITRYSAPKHMHDDTVIALALAWEACGGGENLGAIGAPSLLTKAQREEQDWEETMRRIGAI